MIVIKCWIVILDYFYLVEHAGTKYRHVHINKYSPWNSRAYPLVENLQAQSWFKRIN